MKPPSCTIQPLDRIAERAQAAASALVGATQTPAASSFAICAARIALGLADEDASGEDIKPPGGRSRVMGLFSGGTLCAEAQVIFSKAGDAVISNAPIPGIRTLAEGNGLHTMLDLGDDEYTQGKPHPMIDPSVRDETIIEALGDAGIGVILMDMVIGYGAHGDPAGHLASVLKTHAGKDGPVMIASVTGTEDDPQIRSVQMAKLEAAGVHVAPTNADAAAWAVSAIRSNG